MTIKSPEWHHLLGSGVFVVNFKQTRRFVQVFSLLTLKKQAKFTNNLILYLYQPRPNLHRRGYVKHEQEKVCRFCGKILQFFRKFSLIKSKFFRRILIESTLKETFNSDIVRSHIWRITGSEYNLFVCLQSHWLKSVQIWSFFWSVFSHIHTEYREIRTRKNCVFGHFPRTELAHDLLIYAVCQKASLFRYLWLHMAIQIFDDLAKIPGTTFFSEIPILRSFAKYSRKIFFFLTGKRFLHWSPIRMFFSESLFPLILLELLIMRISHLK